MTNQNVHVTGMGVITPIATGTAQFSSALAEGKTNFSSIDISHGSQQFRFAVARADQFDLQKQVAGLPLEEELTGRAKRLRNISASAAYSVFCTLEAWADAGLNHAGVNPERIAIVTAGSNIQQSALYSVQEKYREKTRFLPPHYGLNFFDTDITGILSELLSVKGEGFSVGAASASGNMAIIQGHRLVCSNEYDVVIVTAPLMDLSIYEYQGFVALGAMAEMTADAIPSELCRPFDAGHRGFVYGQSAGCLILEPAEHAAKRGRRSYGAIAGYGLGMDANRNPNPSVTGELRAMQSAMNHAGISAKDIDYVNTHGTASKIGDETEVAALVEAGLKDVRANSTKSLIGHGLSAAGLVECIASLVQMKDGFMHPSRNLANPISGDIRWAGETAEPAEINYALSNSFGFGGISTSIVIKK